MKTYFLNTLTTAALLLAVEPSSECLAPLPQSLQVVALKRGKVAEGISEVLITTQTGLFIAPFGDLFNILLGAVNRLSNPLKDRMISSH